MRRLTVISLLLAILCTTATASAQYPAQQYPWMRLPPTPTLPEAEHSGTVPVNGIRLWYAMFGRGNPVILLHGGLANANYWGLQVRALAPHYEVIVVDSRGHGRSTRTDAPITYDLMASDVLGLMDYLHIRKAAVVGWSDGAIIGLDLAIHHPDRLTALFAFAANSDPSGVKDVNKSPVFTAFIARASREYRQLSPTPTQFQAFLANITNMWATEPHFTDAQLRGIRVPTWIVDADHDEAIKRENTDHMAALIPGAGELILPEVSHFAFIQDPDMFNSALLHFLSQPRPNTNKTTGHVSATDKRRMAAREEGAHGHAVETDFVTGLGLGPLKLGMQRSRRSLQDDLSNPDQTWYPEFCSARMFPKKFRVVYYGCVCFSCFLLFRCCKTSPQDVQNLIFCQYQKSVAILTLCFFGAHVPGLLYPPFERR